MKEATDNRNLAEERWKELEMLREETAELT